MQRSEKWIARNARIARFSEALSIRPDSPRGKNLSSFSEKNSEFERAVKSSHKRAVNLAIAFELNGAGLFVDQYLRNFLSEYNARILKGGGDKQPTSFNILNAFVEPDEHSLILKLLQEHVYSTNLSLILDYLTSPENTIRMSSLQNELDEFAIYELNMLGGYSEFRIPGHEDFVFCGVAYVRLHDELSIIGVFAKDNPNPQVDLSSGNRGIIPGKEFLLEDMAQPDFSDDSFFGDPSFRPIILLTRINLSDERVQARYVLDEKKDGFLVLTDDPAVHEEMRALGRDDIEARIRTSIEGVQKFEGLFGILNLIPTFTASIQKRDDDIIVERRPTKFKTESASTRIRVVKSSLGPSLTPNYVEVRTIVDSESVNSSYVTPESGLKIETGGYWKTLSLGAIGADKFGRSIQGKTWVETRHSWFENLGFDLESVGRPVKIDIDKIGDEAVGYVYVMRSSAHPKDVYKIGFTLKSPDERAVQLTSESGQPDMFGVVQSWRVKSPRSIERKVHDRLSVYRINRSREFFRLKYREIRMCIEQVIEASGALIDE